MAIEQTAEVIDFTERFPKRNTLYLGHIALGHEHLGVNDPKTHLHMYLEQGDAAMTAIKEDLAADVAERLPDDPFINKVQFEFTGSDFVSLKDRVSMKMMTAINQQIVREEALKNAELSEELARSKLEATEPYAVEGWFKQAAADSYLIFESLPIGEQEFAIPRIYKKIDDYTLEGYFLSLHSASVPIFNELRRRLGVDAPPGRTPLEILANYYEYRPAEAFIDTYVQTYDGILQDKDITHREYAYGVPDRSRSESRNGAEIARNPRLSAIYEDMIKSLAGSDGLATQKIIDIVQKLELKITLAPGQRLTLDTLSQLMEGAIKRIASVVDNASPEILEGLARPDAYFGTAYTTAAHYGGQAEAAGQNYASGGCPSAARSGGQNEQAKGTEAGILAKAYGLRGEVFNDFGKEQWGVCRTSNCISRGESIFWPSKTLVGGCDLCVNCHVYYKKGRDPKLEHKKVRAELKAKNDEQERQKQIRQKMAA